MPKPLTKDAIAAILALYTDGRLDTSLLEEISRVAHAIIDEEVRQATSLLSIDYTIDAVALALEWVDMMPERVNGMNAVTKARLTTLLEDALAEGATLEDVSGSIAEMFDGMDLGRAVVIARTEVLGATNFATWRSYSIANVPYKRWVATMDDRVRDTHAEANGQRRGVRELFSVGGSLMMYPGDPSAEAKEVINCRCFIVPELLSRSTIWTMDRLRAIWTRYLARSVQYDKLMIPAVRREFKNQHSLITSVLHRYGQ